MEIDGSELRALAVDLTNAGAKAGKAAQPVVRKTTLDIERDAKILCPVDTGNLMGSISHSDLRTAGQSGTIQAEVGPTANYGFYVEMGTSRMGPQPYMGPALDRNAGPFEDAMGQIIEGLL